MVKQYRQVYVANAVGTGAITSTSSASDAGAIEQREVALQRIIAEVHREVVRSTPRAWSRHLQEALSTQLVAYMTGQSDRTVQRWARGDIQDVRLSSRRRLITAYEILRLIDRFERPGVAATWFISNEPQLDYTMPAEAIRNDQLEEALAAARSFVTVG